MWKKIREFIFIQSDIPSVQEDFERAEEASGALLMDDPGIAVVDQMPPRYEEAQRTVTEDYERAEIASKKMYWDGDSTETTEEEQLRQSTAQHTVNRALAMYCEICDKSFAHTGLAKNHKRLAHKTI